jgi:hypothetical protein
MRIAALALGIVGGDRVRQQGTAAADQSATASTTRSRTNVITARRSMKAGRRPWLT